MRVLRAGEPTGAKKQLQDFLFRYIARKQAAGLPVHIHTPAAVALLQLTNGNPLLPTVVNVLRCSR